MATSQIVEKSASNLSKRYDQLLAQLPKPQLGTEVDQVRQINLQAAKDIVEHAQEHPDDSKNFCTKLNRSLKRGNVETAKAFFYHNHEVAVSRSASVYPEHGDSVSRNEQRQKKYDTDNTNAATALAVSMVVLDHCRTNPNQELTALTLAGCPDLLHTEMGQSALEGLTSNIDYPELVKLGKLDGRLNLIATIANEVNNPELQKLQVFLDYSHSYAEATSKSDGNMNNQVDHARIEMTRATGCDMTTAQIFFPQGDRNPNQSLEGSISSGALEKCADPNAVSYAIAAAIHEDHNGHQLSDTVRQKITDRAPPVIARFLTE